MVTLGEESKLTGIGSLPQRIIIVGSKLIVMANALLQAIKGRMWFDGGQFVFVSNMDVLVCASVKM
jgi:hypothetical protein